MPDTKWKNCPVTGWAKLERNCHECDKPGAEIEFTFSASGLPANYIRSGSFAQSWHWQCLPAELKAYQSHDEATMIEVVQTPSGLS